MWENTNREKVPCAKYAAPVGSSPFIPTDPPHVKAPPGARQYPDHGSQFNCGVWVKAYLTVAEREWDFLAAV
jgi:hypothetical protein